IPSFGASVFSGSHGVGGAAERCALNAHGAALLRDALVLLPGRVQSLPEMRRQVLRAVADATQLPQCAADDELDLAHRLEEFIQLVLKFARVLNAVEHFVGIRPAVSGEPVEAA